ncbi:hypothetical protein QYF36_019592 [Acer negundo]|nr:hypothetical protein QYF36_019592 [Acer negundo]
MVQIYLVSNDKELRDYPFSLRSPESSPSIPTGKKRKDYPLSDDDGGYLQLRRFDRHARVGFSFTNTADSPLAVSGKESDEEGDNDIKVVRSERYGADAISLANVLTLFMPNGFSCILDSTATKDTITLIRREYNIPLDVLLSLPVKCYNSYTSYKGHLPIYVFVLGCGLRLSLHLTLHLALHVFQLAPIRMTHES